MKPSKGIPTRMTPEEKAAQMERFFSMKRETYFQLILSNTIQAVGHAAEVIDLKTIVDLSLDAADYTVEKLFPLPEEEKKDLEVQKEYTD